MRKSLLSIAMTLGAGLAAMTAPAAYAQALLTQKVLPLRLETDAAQAAIDACAAGNFHVSVVIVDADGNAKAMLLADGAIFTTADSARRKAYTAVMMRRATSAIQQAIAANPGAPLPGDGNPAMLFLAGGLPIRAGGEVIGAIGVGGAASEQDEKCAQAGLDKIQPYLR
jgi:uncharacterized protein GlcG (DUF336 family)